MQKATGIKQGAFTVFRANRWLKGIFRKTPDHCPCTQYVTAAAQYYKQDILQKTTLKLNGTNLIRFLGKTRCDEASKKKAIFMTNGSPYSH